MKNNLVLKLAILSCCFVTASLNAIAGNIPAMAADMKDIPLTLIELVTTIPSLFSMAAVLFSSKIASAIGYKRIVLLGSLIAGIFGTLPLILNNIWLILMARGVFGFGCGLITSAMLILIIFFFEGNERSSMIGLQGSAGGLASLVTAFIAGRLLSISWHASFLVYLFGFLVFFAVLFFIPHVGSIRTSAAGSGEAHSGSEWIRLIALGLLTFVSVTLATVFVVKCSSLAAIKEIGGSSIGSTLVMCISAGSLLAGFNYGRMKSILKRLSLPVFYLICAAGFALAFVSGNAFLMMAAAFLLGFGYLAFVPFLQERVSTKFASFAATGTTVILVFQGLGAFIAPYAGTILSLFTESLNTQFLICGGLYVILAAIGFVIGE
ncbi:MAG: MFS transporter [Erysipelotrichaceae bacterium]|nr:MFS transporter [Erysipelotrichaceae bacterium]